MNKRIVIYLSFVLQYLLFGGLFVIAIWLYFDAPDKFAQISAALLIGLLPIVICLFIVHHIRLDYHRALYIHHLILKDRREKEEK